MGNIMANLIKQNIEELKELDKQRIAWLRISGFVALIIILIIVTIINFTNICLNLSYQI